jgi:hypothetical protein
MSALIPKADMCVKLAMSALANSGHRGLILSRRILLENLLGIERALCAGFIGMEPSPPPRL